MRTEIDRLATTLSTSVLDSNLVKAIDPVRAVSTTANEIQDENTVRFAIETEFNEYQVTVERFSRTIDPKNTESDDFVEIISEVKES